MMFPKFANKIVLLLFTFLLFFLTTASLLLIFLPNNYANKSHHCAELEILQEQIHLLKEDFERYANEVRNRMKELEYDHRFIPTNAIDHPSCEPDRGTISTTRKDQSSKTDEELKSLLQDIVSRNTESSSRITQVNNTANELIPVRRDIPDTRHKDCSTLTYPDVTTMPTVSVVMIFCDEPLRLILRTIHSILDRSPTDLIREIILVDDNSTLAYLKDDLDLYVSFLPNVKVIRNKKREGLIKSRMIGARSASSEVLVFFDAHMECNVQWLEPLLTAIMEEPTAIVQPFIDIISYETFTISSVKSEFTGGFDWNLQYSWYKLPKEFRKERSTDQFWTAVLVGNAIAITRLHFFKIGGFYEDLKIWGGEHFDLSFRNWLCAGRVYTVPCSRVGHVYKKTSGYSFDGDQEAIVTKNLMRVAEIWLEDYKDIFYRVTKSTMKSNMPVLTQEDSISIEKRLQLKRRLNCRPFQWYLNNVIPYLVVPRKDAVLFGEVAHVESNECFNVAQNNVTFTNECSKFKVIPSNIFTFTKSNQLLCGDMCVYIDKETHQLRVNRCADMSGVLKGRWEFVLTRVRRQGQFQFVTEKGENLCVYKHDGNPVAVTCSEYGPGGDTFKFRHRLADTGN